MAVALGFNPELKLKVNRLSFANNHVSLCSKKITSESYNFVNGTRLGLNLYFIVCDISHFASASTNLCGSAGKSYKQRIWRTERFKWFSWGIYFLSKHLPSDRNLWLCFHSCYRTIFQWINTSASGDQLSPLPNKMLQKEIPVWVTW